MMNPLYQDMETSVFERMSLAAASHGAVNLGQGFPDFGWPDEILGAAAKAVIESSNQYVRDERRDRGAGRRDFRDGFARRRGDRHDARI